MAAFISLLSIVYPEERGRVQSARGTGSTVGSCLGAVLGGSLIGVLGYFGVFLASTVLTFLTLFALFLFPERKDERNSQNAPSQLSYCQVLSVRRTLVTLLSYGAAGFLLFTLEPTLAIKLRDDFSLPTSTISLFFMVMLLGYALFCIFSMLLLKNTIRGDS